jgi:hypothetical protein
MHVTKSRLKLTVLFLLCSVNSLLLFQLIDWLRREEKVVCLCREVTDMVFGNSFFVAPNAIDFLTVFLKFSPLSQAAVFGTLTGIFIIYIISVILLARLDRKDKLKVHIRFTILMLLKLEIMKTA